MASKSWTTTSKHRTTAIPQAFPFRGLLLCASLPQSLGSRLISIPTASPRISPGPSSQPVDSSDLSPIPHRNDFASQGSNSGLHSLMRELHSSQKTGSSTSGREFEVDARLRELMGSNSGSLFDYLNEIRGSSRDSARDRMHQLMNEPRSQDTDSMQTQNHNFAPKNSNPFVSAS